MKQELEQVVAAAVQDLFSEAVTVELTRPEEQFGDYATNVALQLAKKVGKNPREIAEALAQRLTDDPFMRLQKAEVAGPGFLNLTLADAALVQAADIRVAELFAGKRVLLEYSCPNPFKEIHAGHLYQTVAGDALGRILEATGVTVFRANFGGDVGLHVGKCLYGVVETLGGELPKRLADVPAESRAEWLSSAYVRGAKAYEDDPQAKEQIASINTTVYAFHTMDDHETPLAQIYWTCRQWSYDYFKTFYDQIEVEPFDRYYPESETTEPGLAVVRANMGTVFTESDGAVVYKGEDAGLHTRVFITSQGLPTYETKDTGVIMLEAKDFSYDRRVIMTGNDQSEYMKVVFAALHAVDADLAAKQVHLVNGTVKFGSGQKMSSRLGNVTRAIDVVAAVDDAVAAVRPDSDHAQTALAAIKYTFLKHRLGGDIAFDINESVSLEGNSGPYLQYAHARARSVLARAHSAEADLSGLLPAERSLVRKLAEYNEVVARAADDLLPHLICTYLYELAQRFNQFYEYNRVIGDEREAIRLGLVRRYADTLKHGLEILGISAPERM